ncbi:MAG: glucosaminidase domain-containing protein [Bdellovibrionales bacterium]|nr:glucosaminidase domain-containing protein [Bdellovibrionales bacterium]
MMYKSIHLFIALLFSIQTPVLMGLEVTLEGKGINTRYMGPSVKDDEMIDGGYLTSGSTINIPDKYIDFKNDLDSKGRLRLNYALSRWLQDETAKPRPGLYNFREGSKIKREWFFPLQKGSKVKKGSHYSDSLTNYVALDYLIRSKGKINGKIKREGKEYELAPGSLQALRQSNVPKYVAENKRRTRKSIGLQVRTPAQVFNSNNGSFSQSYSNINSLLNAQEGQEFLQCKNPTLGSENQCQNLSTDLVDLPYKSYFVHARNRVGSYIQWIKPMAQYIQAQTGLPASLIISQSGHETGWGTSGPFLRSTALFGHSCRVQGEVRQFHVKVGNIDKRFTAICGHNRPKNEGGYYYQFETPEDSVLAYVYNLLFNTNRNHYPGLRRELAHLRTYDPAGVLPFTEALRNIPAYASDRLYFQKVSNVNRSFSVSSADSNTCQECLQYLVENGARSSIAPLASASPQSAIN